MRSLRIPLFATCLALALTAFASVVGSVRGVIHDPQHRPVQNAMVMLKAKSSDWSTTANSDANGEFIFNAVPLGEYIVTVAALGFDQTRQDVAVMTSAQPVLHFALNVATGDIDFVSGSCDRGGDFRCHDGVATLKQMRGPAGQWLIRSPSTR